MQFFKILLFQTNSKFHLLLEQNKFYNFIFVLCDIFHIIYEYIFMIM